jgi:hypothetical protein
MFELSSKGVGLRECYFANSLFFITHSLLRRKGFVGCFGKEQVFKVPAVAKAMAGKAKLIKGCQKSEA